MNNNFDPSGSSVSPSNDSDESKQPRPFVKRRRATNVSPAIKSALAQQWLSFIAGCGKAGRRFVSEFRDAVLHGPWDRKKAVAFLRPLRRGPLGPKVDEIEASIERTTGVTQHQISRWARQLLERENDFPVPEVIRGAGTDVHTAPGESQPANILAAAHLATQSEMPSLQAKNSAQGGESQGAIAASKQTGGGGIIAKPSTSMAFHGSERDEMQSRNTKATAGGNIDQVSGRASGVGRANTDLQVSPTAATIARAKRSSDNQTTMVHRIDAIHLGLPASAGGEPTGAPSPGGASKATTGALAVVQGSGGDSTPREQAGPTTLQNLYIHATAGASASSAPTGLAPIPRPPAGSSPRSSPRSSHEQRQQPAMGSLTALAHVPTPHRGPTAQPAMDDDAEPPEDFARGGSINPTGTATALPPSAHGPAAATNTTTGPISMRTSRGRAVRRPATWTEGEVQLNGVNVLGSGSEALKASTAWHAVRDREDDEDEDGEEGSRRKNGPRRMRVHLRRGESPSSAAQRARARLGQLAAGSIDAGAGRLLLLHKIAASTSTDMLNDDGHVEGSDGDDDEMGKGTKPLAGKIHPEWPFGSIRCDQFDADVFPASIRGLPRRMERAVRKNAGLLAFSQHLYASVIRESEPKIVGAVLSVLRKHGIAVPSTDVLASGSAGQQPANAGPSAWPQQVMQHPQQATASVPPPMGMGMGMGVPMGAPKTTTSEQGVATTLVTTFPVPETNAAMGATSSAAVSSSSTSSAAFTAAPASSSLLPRTTAAGTAAGAASTSAPTPSYAFKQALQPQAHMQSVVVSRDQLFGSEPSASLTSGQGEGGAPAPAAGDVDRGVGRQVGASRVSNGFHHGGNDTISRLMVATPRASAQAIYSGSRGFGAPVQSQAGCSEAGSDQIQGTIQSSGVPSLLQKPPSLQFQRWEAPTDKAESDRSGSCRSGDESGSVVSGMSVRGEAGRHREGFEEGMHEVREGALLTGVHGAEDGPMGSGLGMGKALLGGEDGGVPGSGRKRAAEGLLAPDEPSAKRARR